MSAALAYGLSVHHFISQVGAYVGFAAIIAVAIMVFLLFAHARETAELRRRADQTDDELSLLHEQVQWLRDQQGGMQQRFVPAEGAGPTTVPPPQAAGARVAATTATATAAVATAAAVSATGATRSTPVAPPPPVPAPESAARRDAPLLGAPLGVGAPALSSATKLIPPTDDELATVAAAREQHLGSAAAGGASDSNATRVETVAAAPALPPATAAAAGNGRSSRQPSADAAAAPVTSPRRDYASSTSKGSRWRGRGAVIAAGVLLVAAIAVVLVLVLDHGGSNSDSGARAGAATTVAHTGHNASDKGKRAAAKVNVNPQSVTVAVLNGTLTTNLAADVSSKLSARGFQQGATGNATDQSLSKTTVGYVQSVPGAKNDALAVAHLLNLPASSVQTVSAADQAVACGGSTANCPDQVIVTVGSDLNSDAT